MKVSCLLGTCSTVLAQFLAAVPGTTESSTESSSAAARRAEVSANTDKLKDEGYDFPKPAFHRHGREEDISYTVYRKVLMIGPLLL